MYIRLAVLFSVGLSLLVLFTDCSRTKFNQSPNSGSPSTAAFGGGGIDGMNPKFLSYGLCGKLIGLSARVDVKNGAFTLVRQNCQNLPSPIAIQAKDLQFPTSDTSRFIYQNMVFDLQSGNPASQTLTVQFCQSSSGIQALIWQTLGDPTSLSGKVIAADSATTGALAIVPPDPAAPGDYKSKAGLSSSMEVNIASAPSAAVDYVIGGQAAVVGLAATCASQPVPTLATSAPRANLHYAPNSNFTSSGAFDPGLTALGIQLADVNNLTQFAALPPGGQALVYLNLCTAPDAGFQNAVLSYTRNASTNATAASSLTTVNVTSTAGLTVGMILTDLTNPAAVAEQTKITAISPSALQLSQSVTIASGDKLLGVATPNLFGFYLVDSPDPATCPPANLDAQSTWIHNHLGSSVATFVVLGPQAGSFSSGYSYCSSSPCNATNHYASDNTSIDYFGVTAYVCRSELPGTCDFSGIARNYEAAILSGVKSSSIIPIYQAFGGAADDDGGSFITPTAAQLSSLLDAWGAVASGVAWDYYYSWGVQSGDSALQGLPDLQNTIQLTNILDKP